MNTFNGNSTNPVIRFPDWKGGQAGTITLATNDTESHLNVYIKTVKGETHRPAFHEDISLSPTAARQLRDELLKLYPVVETRVATKDEVYHRLYGRSPGFVVMDEVFGKSATKPSNVPNAFLVTNGSNGDACEYPTLAEAERKATNRAETSGRKQRIWKLDAQVQAEAVTTYRAKVER